MVNRCTFFTVAALQVMLGTVQTTAAGSPLFLQHLIHSLDDAVQRLVHIDPNLLLGRRQKILTQICRM